MALPSKLGPIDQHIGGLLGSLASYGVNADAVVQASFFESAAPASSSDLSLAVTEGADTASSSLGLAIGLSMAVTEGADSASGTAGLVVSLSLSASEAADTASSAVDLVVSLACAASEGADTLDASLDVVAGASDLALDATEGADIFTALMDRPADPLVGPAAYPDRFAGPVKPLGVLGRLAIERQLAEDGQEVIVAITGLRSETVTIAGESTSGSIIGYPVVRHLKSGAIVTDSVLQNGVFVIRVDDLKPVWDNLVFIKSGNDDRVQLQIESLFEYVERPVVRNVARGVAPPAEGWSLSEWGNMRWGG